MTEPSTATPTLSPLGRGRVGASRPGEGEAAAPRPDLTSFARDLRRSQTAPERLLWSRLRGRRLGGWKFRRQVPIGRYVADFFCPDAWLLVELDGGGHGSPATIERDAARTRDLERAGYLVVRFWNREVLDNLDGVCETILATAQGRAGR